MDSKTVQIGLTGVGGRGWDLLKTLVTIDNVEVLAVCDMLEENRQKAIETIRESGGAHPDEYTDHRDLVGHENLDCVVIATPWRYHIPMAITAMKAGKDVAFEVGPASSVEECWDLVKTHEETGSSCMLLENYCFMRNNMAVLNMVRQGVFGELIHGKTGYQHDLRERIVTGKGTGLDVGDSGDYQTRQHQYRNADLYPTHGVGPIAKCLKVNRGNRFVSLTATASKARGLEHWAQENLDPDHPNVNIDWATGDVVMTTIKCSNGETITITNDMTLPHPKSTGSEHCRYQIRGTKGIWMDAINSIYLDDQSDNEWEDFEDYRKEYEHPLWEQYSEVGTQSKHGGTDYLALRSFIEAVRRGVRTPIDAYDAAAWMSITPLTEQSISLGNDSVAFPDFTNGEWMHNEPVFGLVEETKTGTLPTSAIFDSS